MNIGDDAQPNAQILSQLGAILTFQHRLAEAASVYAELDKAIAKWEPRRREVLELNGSRINAMFASGQTQAGLEAAQSLLKREIARVGEKHYDAASARGILAAGLMRAGKNADAIREFKVALPILLAASRENTDDDDATVIAGRSQRLQGIVEAYIKLLANTQAASGDIAADTFSLADSIRGRSVQQALTASSARASIKDAALAELVRNEQDLAKQVSAQLGLLNNILALPSAQRDDKGVKGVNASIEKLRSDRDKARTEINKRFPSYADLVDPKPPSVAQIKATLTDGRARCCCAVRARADLISQILFAADVFGQRPCLVEARSLDAVSACWTERPGMKSARLKVSWRRCPACGIRVRQQLGYRLAEPCSRRLRPAITGASASSVFLPRSGQRNRKRNL